MPLAVGRKPSALLALPPSSNRVTVGPPSAYDSRLAAPDSSAGIPSQGRKLPAVSR